MLEDINTAFDIYWANWRKFIETRKNKALFESLHPTAVGWKVADFAEFQRCMHELCQSCDQIHMGVLNDRWIATLHLRDQKIGLGIELIKLMQLRPGSKDKLGLDHLDFLLPAGTSAKAFLGQESGLKWTEEKNGLCEWTSIWFDDTEAKLRTDTTFDVGAAELTAVSKQIKDAGKV